LPEGRDDGTGYGSAQPTDWTTELPTTLRKTYQTEPDVAVIVDGRHAHLMVNKPTNDKRGVGKRRRPTQPQTYGPGSEPDSTWVLEKDRITWAFASNEHWALKGRQATEPIGQNPVTI